jgi:transposase
MTLEEENARLRAENEGLRRQQAEALGTIVQLRQLVGELEARVAELEAELAQLKGGPPSFVKANRPKPTQPKKPRKKRAPHHNHARRRQTPTRTVDHVLERCPECDCHLSGTSLDYSRQVIELPEPTPVEVIEHRVIRRYCPKCEAWRSPRLDLSGQVLGQGRMGVRLVSVIAYLREVMRLPTRMIQAYLGAMHQLTISVGEIVELLHQAREATVKVVDGLKREVRESAIIHADETGWRENGHNGYIWSFSTPGDKPVRYYEYDPGRSQAVVKRVLGEENKGHHLVSDFYCGYNDYAGPQQRCWVHLLRDLHDLKKKHESESGVLEWAKSVKGLHDDAKEWLAKNRDPSSEDRQKEYVELVGRSHELGLKYARDKKHASFALCKRILRHEDELFQFVLVPGLSSDNNQAERAIRPEVVIRKISGGSRSSDGSKTRMALASLFQTWLARGLNPLAECIALLSRLPVSA